MLNTIKALFKYRKTSLTLLVVLSIALSIVLSSIDFNQLECEESAWLDLKIISQQEHSYGSPANLKVHNYLERRIKEISSDFDIESKKLFFENHFYQSNNLLVRINGTESWPALLLSAHYDSVPSSYGVTDDGMGVATLLNVLSSIKKPKRTIIFNFNNNEEFGLYGAKAFVDHPWFKEVKYFLNLEGTGAGGKAILFRSTDYGIGKYFKKVKYPFASSIFQQGFNRGLIHSETDYKVYKDNGLRGLDLAFYKPRDIYHTKEDNIRNVRRSSLAHMISNAKDFTNYVMNHDITDSDEQAIFTSFLNYFFIISSSALFKINLILIVSFVFIGPFIFKFKWNVINLPLAMIASFITSGLLLQYIRLMNTFLPTAYPMLLVSTVSSVSILIYYVILNGINFIWPGDRLVSILEISLIYWVILIFVSKDIEGYTGSFPLTVVFLLQLIALILGVFGWLFTREKKLDEEQPLLDEESERESDHESEHGSQHGSQQEAEHELRSKQKDSYEFDWSLQFLSIVPLSLYIIYNSGWLVIDGIHKSIQESLASEKTIYYFIFIFSQLWIFPVLPYIYKFNRFIVSFFVLFSIGGIFVSTMIEPFNELNPLKLRYLQDNNQVRVYGRKGLVYDVISEIPNSKVTCEDIPDGNEVCSYKTYQPDFLTVDVSSSELDGLNIATVNITGSPMCNIKFGEKNVRAIIVDKNEHLPSFKNIPKGYSNIKGNIIYKDVSGIDSTYVNSLTNSFNLSFYYNEDFNADNLTINLQCFTSEDRSNYEDLIHYSPNYVTIANKEKGLVSVSRKLTI